MSDRDYISTASKRAAAVAATFASIFCLYEFGFADPDQPARLPLLGIVLRPETAQALLYFGVAASFVSWAAKVWFESPFDETPEFATIRAKSTEITDARLACVNLQSSLQTLEAQLMMRNYGNVSILDRTRRDGAAKGGFQVIDFDTDGLPQKIVNEWELLLSTREQHREATAKHGQREKELRDLRNHQAGIRLHSWVFYVCGPAFICVLALVSGLHILFDVIRNALN